MSIKYKLSNQSSKLYQHKYKYKAQIYAQMLSLIGAGLVGAFKIVDNQLQRRERRRRQQQQARARYATQCCYCVFFIVVILIVGYVSFQYQYHGNSIKKQQGKPTTIQPINVNDNKKEKDKEKEEDSNLNININENDDKYRTELLQKYKDQILKTQNKIFELMEENSKILEQKLRIERNFNSHKIKTKVKGKITIISQQKIIMNLLQFQHWH